MIRCASCGVPISEGYVHPFLGKNYHENCVAEAAIKILSSVDDSKRCPSCALVPDDYYRLRDRLEKLEDENSKHVRARLERLEHQEEITDA